MKRTGILLVLLTFFGMIGLAQDAEEKALAESNDTTQSDSIWQGSLVGLNVYPAFGMIGGGIMPSSKIFFQYKHHWEKSSMRVSANYINFHSVDDRLDLVMVGDTSIIMRQYNNNVYTVDLRVGYERVMPMEGFRFYYGLGLMGGYHHFGKTYYHYEESYENYPVEGINRPVELNMLGWYRADMLKLGVDFSLGVDLLLSDNVIMSVQYTPELAYYMLIDSEEEDDADVFDGDLVQDFLDFRGDYIDLVLSVKF
ncbi:MAG: hypothetical protein ACLFM1_03760 [Bacteroidales bacterium]